MKIIRNMKMRRLRNMCEGKYDGQEGAEKWEKIMAEDVGNFNIEEVMRRRNKKEEQERIKRRCMENEKKLKWLVNG